MKRLLWAVFALSVALVSCTKELNLESDVNKNKIILNASVEQHNGGDVKTSLSSGLVKWVAGDKISILSSANPVDGGDEFTLISNPGEVYGRFGGDLTDGASTYYTLYPYNTTARLESDVVKFKIPRVQNYSEDSFANGANATIGYFNNVTDNIVFKNICGVFELRLKKGTEDITVKKIVLVNANENPLWGNVNIPVESIASGEPVSTIVGGTNAVVLDNINVPLTGTYTSFFFVVPVGAMSGGFTAYIYSADDVCYTYMSSANDNVVSRSKIRYMPEKSVEAISECVLGEASNCYVAPCAGTYEFAAQKGKGGATVSPSSVAVLWSSYNTLTAPERGDEIIKNVGFSGNTISFTATGKAGNAVIAAFDSDGSTVLWSWHVWCNVPEVQKYNGFTVMDRNLGALSGERGKTEALGLFYQYGRKDPFMGYGNITAKATNTNIAKYYGNNGISFEDKKHTVIIEEIGVDTDDFVPYSIAHPMTYISESPWTSETTLWNAENKTGYDPCPIGYKIARYNLYKSAGTNTQSNWKTDEQNRGLYYDAYDIWLPMSGWINNTYDVGTYMHVGNYGIIGSNTMSNAVLLYNFTNYWQVGAYGWKTLGCAQRCIKE